jgi:hypothetical protein
MALLAAAVGTALLGLWVAVTDLPNQIFGIGLASTAFCVLVYALNESRRGDARTQHDNARLRKENDQLRRAVYRLTDSTALDQKTRRDVRQVMQEDVDDGDEETA